MVSGRLLAHFSSLIYLRKGEGREEAVIAFYAADEQPTCSRVGRGRKGTVGKPTFFSTSTLTTLRPLFLFFLPFLFSCRGNIPSFFNFFVQVVFLLSKKIICWLRLVEKQAYITLFLYVVLKTQSRNFFVLYPFPKVLGLCSL